MNALVDADGKVLIGSDGKVATDDCPENCCGDPCTGTPSGSCTYYVDFEFLLDQAEVDGSPSAGNIIDFDNYFLWPDYPNQQWVFGGPDGDDRFMPFAGTIADVWHSGRVALSSDGTNVTSYFCIDGVQTETWVTDGEIVGDAQATLVIGSEFPFESITHRSIRNVKVFSNNPADFTNDSPFVAGDPTVVGGFALLPARFDVLTGSGITFPDETSEANFPLTALVKRNYTTLRIDNDTSDSAFVTEYYDGFDFVCCCDELTPFAGITTMKLDFSITGSLSPGSDFAPTCLTVDKTLSKTWTRVAATATPGESEFKLFCTRSYLDPPDFPPFGISSVAPRRIDFKAGGSFLGVPCAGNCQGLRIGTSIADGGDGSSGATCEDPFAHTTFEDPDNALGVELDIGNFNIGPGQSDCGMLGIEPHWIAGWVCHDQFAEDNSLPNPTCGSAGFGVDATTIQIAYEDLIGTHVFTDHHDFGFGIFDATWTLTVS